MTAKNEEARGAWLLPDHRFDDPFPALPRSIGEEAEERGGTSDLAPQREPFLESVAGSAVAVAVTEGVMRVNIVVPGLDATKMAVSLADDALILKGSDCRFGAFTRVVHLPLPALGDQVRVSFTRSVLSIDVPVDTARSLSAPSGAGKVA